MRLLRFFSRPFAALLAVVLVGALVLAGCSGENASPDYVARVGEQYLRPADLRTRMDQLPPGIDSAAARRQLIREWTTSALLYREARDRGLLEDSAIQRRIEESRQSVLVHALLGQFYDEVPEDPPAEAVREYFERHREALRFTVPHVRVRHLSTSSEEAARTAHRRLSDALPTDGAADTAWTALTRRYAADSARARDHASGLFAEPTLFPSQPVLSERLAALEGDALAPVFEEDGRYHVLQLVERVPAGTLPELAWVEDEIRERVVLQRRKQMYARQVERLRTQARSSGALETSE